MSGDITQESPNKSRGIQHILLFGLFMALPGLQSSLFGLMYFFIPLVVLFYLYKWENGKRFILAGVVLGTIISLIFHSFGTLLITATFIPPGYALAQSAFRNNSPARSGLKGTIALVGCWLLLITIFTAATGINPITDFLGSLDAGIEQALLYYSQSESAAPDTIALLEQSFNQITRILPKIIPSVIVGFALLTIWFTMLSGNHIVQKFTGYLPWPDHRQWLLPDTLIWILIGSALLAMLPIGFLRLVGINVLIIFSFIYFFQGFSIFSFFMKKWNIPLLLRAFFYGMMLFQSFGTVLLLVVGIGDVWFDLRRLNTVKDENDSGDDEPQQPFL